MGVPYKLHYFEVRHRAEPIRVLLHYVGLPFEDVTHSFAQWPSVKSNMPLRSMPVLEVKDAHGDVLKIGQTTAILRYLGKRHGLEANTPAGQATCDMFGEQIQDYVSGANQWTLTFLGLAPAEKREEIFAANVQPAIDGIGELLGGQLKKNGNGYLVGSKLTWVDIFLADLVDKIVGHTRPDIFAKYPLVEAHYKKIFSLPTIAKYVKERPSYPY